MPRINVKDKRKQQLMEANIASIAKRGFTDTTITHISQGAGMSRGIINFYFTSKEMMMLETLSFITDEATACWQTALEAAGKGAKEKLQALVEAGFHPSICNNKRLAVWSSFIGHATTHQEYKKIIAAADDQLLKAAEELFVKAGKKEEAARRLAHELHAMIRGFWLMLLITPNQHDRKSLAALCQEWVTGQLGEAPKAAPLPKEKAEKPAPKPQQAAAPKPKAPAKPKEPESYAFDFGDLFSPKK